MTITSKFIIGCKNASNKANFNFYIKEHFINCVENLTIKQFDSMLSKREFSPFFVTRTHHCINVWYEKKIHWLQSLKMVQSGITISSWRNKKLNHFHVCEWYNEKLDLKKTSMKWISYQISMSYNELYLFNRRNFWKRKRERENFEFISIYLFQLM